MEVKSKGSVINFNSLTHPFQRELEPVLAFQGSGYSPGNRRDMQHTNVLYSTAKREWIRELAGGLERFHSEVTLGMAVRVEEDFPKGTEDEEQENPAEVFLG